MAPKRRKNRKTRTNNPKTARENDNRSKWLKAVLDYVNETQIDVLNLANKKLGKMEVKGILDFLPESNVTELSLECNSLKNSMVDLAPLLTKTKIKKLNVSLCNLTKDDILRLAEVLKESEITDLVIGEEGFTDRFSLDEASIFISHLQESKLTILRFKIELVLVRSFFGSLFPKTNIDSFVKEFLNTSITCLDLNHDCSVDLAALFTNLRETKIEKLTFNGNCSTDDALNLLVDGLVGSKVTELTLEHQRFSNLSPLFTKVNETQIKTLNVSENIEYLGQEMFIYPDCLRYSCLGSLSLILCALSDKQGEGLIESLKFSNVTKLDVSFNDLGLLTVKKLAENIAEMKLLDFNIYNNVVPLEGFSILGGCLKMSKLTRINVGGMDEDSFTPHRDDLLSFLKLTEGSSVNEIGMDSYWDSWNGPPVRNTDILANTTFTELDLSASNIGVNVTGAFSYLKFSSITHLHLPENNIRDDGAKAIAEFLKDAPIRRLDLHWNIITSQGAKSLALSLKNSNLLFLDLNHNHIEDDGFEVLAENAKDSFVTELEVANNPGKRVLLVDKVLWENKIEVHRLVGFFKQIKPRYDSQEFCFDENSSDSDVSTFLEKCMEFYKTVTDKPKAISVLLEEKTVTYSRAEIRRLLFEEFPRQLSSFIACRIDAELMERVRILETAEKMGLTAIVESLLLHRPVFTLDEEQGILHPYVYQLLSKYKQPVCNLAVEPDGVTKIIKYFTEHADVEGSQDLVTLLRAANIS